MVFRQHIDAVEMYVVTDDNDDGNNYDIPASPAGVFNENDNSPDRE